MIGGRTFSEMIRVSAQKSKLQAKSRSYSTKSQSYSGRPPESEKEPEWGSGASTENPPLKPSWTHLNHPFQNHYTHAITIFELLRGIQLQLSGVFRINSHCSYSFLVFLTECSYRKSSPSWILKNILRLQLHDLILFEFKIKWFRKEWYSKNKGIPSYSGSKLLRTFLWRHF